MGIPEDIVRAFYGQRQTFFTLAQRLFRPLARGDVEDGSRYAEGVSCRIPMDVAARMDKSDFAVRTDDTIFHIVGKLSDKRIIDDG